MKTLAALLLAVPSFAQRVETAASAASAGSGVSAAAGAAVTAVPPLVSAPALSAPSLSGAAMAGPAPAAAVLPASAIVAIDPASLPESGKHYTGAEWAKLTQAAPLGPQAVLRSMHNGSNADLSLKFADGESLRGRFQGLAGDKMVFASDGKLLGVDMNSKDILEVRRQADVWFDGGALRPEEVVVHSQPSAVADPFRDLAAYKGRYLVIDAKDHGDAKRWSAQTIEGKLVRADGNEIELEGPKGAATVWKEDHEIETVRVRTPHYDSKHQVPHLSAVNKILPPGTPVEVEILKKASVKGLFRGVQSDKDGDYVVLETPNADGSTTMRGYRDALSIKTQGYKAGGLMDGGTELYRGPNAVK